MKLSIITVNYNNCNGLKKTINSILSQTWKDFEWIIIDGGSTDGSFEIIKNLSETLSSNSIFNPLSYWCSEKDDGVYNAMNKGIAKANGEYLNFMNSGDVFHEKKTLENVFSSEHTANIIYGDWKRIIKKREESMHFPYPIEIYSFYKENICHQAMFISRDYHVKHFYDESYRILADYKNWAIASLNGVSFEYVPVTICNVSIDGLSSKMDNAQILEFDRLKREVWPDSVKLTLERLESELEEPNLFRVRTLTGKGGLARFLTKGIIKLLCIIFKVE